MTFLINMWPFKRNLGDILEDVQSTVDKFEKLSDELTASANKKEVRIAILKDQVVAERAIVKVATRMAKAVQEILN